jgi:multimeric flavodoxin WrbA
MTILGSPKMEGNTAAALRVFEEAIGDKHEVERVNLPELEVTGCQGCYACQEKPNEASCVVRDGATDVLKRIVGADAVVYATPLFMWGFASKIHALMERHISLVTGFSTPPYKSLVEGKKIALLVTCGGPGGGNTDAIKKVFDGFAQFGKAHAVGKYVVARATTPEETERKARTVIGRMAADFLRP